MLNRERKIEFANTYTKPNFVFALLEDLGALEISLDKDLGDIPFIEILKYFIKKRNPPYNTIKYTRNIISQYQIWSAENYDTDQLPIMDKKEIFNDEIVSLIKNGYKEFTIRNYDELHKYVDSSLLIQDRVYPIDPDKILQKDCSYMIISLVYEGIELEDIRNIKWDDITILYDGIKIVVGDKEYKAKDNAFITIAIMEYILHKSKYGFLIHDKSGNQYATVESLKRKVYYKQDISLKYVVRSGHVKRVKEFEREHNLEPITLDKYSYQEATKLFKRLVRNYYEVTGIKEQYENAYTDLFFMYLNM